MELIPHAWVPEGALPPLEPQRGGQAEGAAPLLVLVDRRDPLVAAAAPRCRALLGAVERDRLKRLHRAGDRERYVLGRGVLRTLLGHWLQHDPAALPIAVDPRGKPFLPGGGQHGSVEFNLSHSGDLVLLGFHPWRPVGVDVERPREVPHWRAIASRWLAPEDLQRIEALPRDDRSIAFLECWCRLEASLKARGVGLGRRDPTSGESPGTGESPTPWTVRVPGGYRAAAALA